MNTRLALSALPLLALAGHALAGVTVVDASSPTPVLQAAIDAAPDGEILLVLPGSSEVAQAITLSGKGLTLVAWPAGSQIEIDRLRIEDLPAGRQVVVRGLTITPAQAYGQSFDLPGLSPAALELVDDAGSVWIEDCEAISPDQNNNSFGLGNHGASLTGCANVVLARCTLVAGNGGAQPAGCGAPFGAPGQDGGSGLRARSSSTVVLHGCLVQGDRGGFVFPGKCPVPGNAGHGLLLESGSRGLFAGGAAIGGDQVSSSATAGSGIRCDATCSIAFRPGTVAPGAGTPAPPAVFAPVGTFTLYPATPRQLVVTSPLAEGQHGSLTVSGQSGDLTAIFIGFAGAYLPVPGKQGVFSLGAPFFGPVLLAVNPSGLWTVPFVAPPQIPTALEGQSFLLQLVIRDGAQVSVEGTTTFVLVDSSLP